MNSLWPIIVGGVLPAIFWGITAIFQKQSATAATGSAVYLIAFGAACAFTGLIAALVWRPAPWSIEDRRCLLRPRYRPDQLCALRLRRSRLETRADLEL